MAKTQKRGGEYRRMMLERQGCAPQQEEPVSFFRLRFYAALCLFVGYMVLDYTKASFHEFDSSRIYAEICRDAAQDLDVEKAFADMVEAIRITE